MFKRNQHIHFVGIGGIGMSGIAEVLMNLGHSVSGSDAKSSAMTRRLKQRGARVHYGHRAQHINGAQVVVVSSAVAAANPEIVEARRQGVPVIPRAEMLAELMRLKYGIAVAGTHGKTTTTSLVAEVLASGGLDPTVIIGGKVNSLRSNARLGQGECLVAEADESDRSFLHLSPVIAVITNIDPEHMENYKDFADVRRAYDTFADRVPYYGSVVCCMDHPEVRALQQRCRRPVVTYGIASAADFTASQIRQEQARLTFVAEHRGKPLGTVTLRMPGRHNVGNALAAIAVGRLLDIPFPRIAAALSRFRGIERRFQILSRGRPLVVSDYGHHPAEIAATMQAARDGWPGKRLVVVHQPHRYTRLQALFADFVSVLSQADAVVLTRLYPASEAPIPGITSRKLVAALLRAAPQMTVQYGESPEAVIAAVQHVATADDLVLFLGAGDIAQVAQQYVKTLGMKREGRRLRM